MGADLPCGNANDLGDCGSVRPSNTLIVGIASDYCQHLEGCRVELPIEYSPGWEPSIETWQFTIGCSEFTICICLDRSGIGV